jgi:hypothetical protein
MRKPPDFDWLIKRWWFDEVVASDTAFLLSYIHPACFHLADNMKTEVAWQEITGRMVYHSPFNRI